MFRKTYLVLSLLLFSRAVSQNTITTDSVLQLGPCAGAQVIVKYQTTGTFPTLGNVFTAQLSSPFGQFTAPVAIGTTSFNLGIILCTLPQNATFGFLYRVRVVSSNPAVTGSQSPNTIIVTSNSFVATITAAPQNSIICPGDTKTLQVLVPANGYTWSTGATTQSIVVTQPGIYSVKVKDILGCESKDTLKLFLDPKCDKTSLLEFEDNLLKYFPNPVQRSGSITFLTQWDYTYKLIGPGGTVYELNVDSEGQAHLGKYQLCAGLYLIQCIGSKGQYGISKLILIDE